MKINIKRIKLGRTTKWGLKAVAFILVILTGLFLTLRQVALWNNMYKIVFTPASYHFDLPEFNIEEQEFVQPIIEMVLPFEVETDIEQYICDTFGAFNCQVALAVMQAESGGNPEAWNANDNGTLDVGLWQINSINWDTCEMTMSDLLDPYNSTDCAKILYDRAGSFNPWVAFLNSSFLNHID
jgi:hypothetical protein